MSISVAEAKPDFSALTSKGIFLGTHLLKDQGGRDFGRFNVFAALQDLNITPSGRRRLLTFEQAAIELGKRERWLGYDGCKFDPAHYMEQLFAGLNDAGAVGKWFIPTREILRGRRGADVRKTHNNSVYDLRETSFGSTFCRDDSGFAHWYWSSSESVGYGPDHVCSVSFAHGCGSWDRKDAYHLSCRPVRVELAL